MSSPILTSWQIPADKLFLQAGIIHLWRFRLTENVGEDFLSPEEWQRARRLRVAEKADVFIVARSRLRQILSYYLNIAPAGVEFLYNENGKPYLDGHPVYFNLSHSGKWGVCALSKNADVGVDLEASNPELKFVPLAERFFTKNENLWLRSASDLRRRRYFFRLWTRKEAWLKGKGGGFSEINLGLNAEHLSVNSSMADGWWLTNLPVAKGYVGAIAVASEVKKVERWSWGE
ncbi:MAG: 4'-phosphopantetheinyl transferase superfamily protein [Gammaproteobacteria bacterium]|nr:4'-phosphopantetheinyl transferase superfamily protein [Gammaproteobacteria bacterium]NIR25685.1 4'-phosphopantetheinyl transferase superfamily protein [Gammaproteobacteria bacterium]